ncbi:uncharacterized protein [Clytia hemisphaerica]
MECDDFVSDAEPIEWEKVFDEDTGRWKFHEKAPSVWRVSDKRDEIYQENIKRRAIQILLGQEIKLIPSKNGNCGCEGGWYNEENPDGHIMPRGETIVYSLPWVQPKVDFTSERVWVAAAFGTMTGLKTVCFDLAQQLPAGTK